MCKKISIHALREEGDAAVQGVCQSLEHFYPRPPRGGRPSTLSSIYSSIKDFYPRPPRGGRHAKPGYIFQHRKISIHALREEGDP